ncbi:hypothetical protein B9Q04_04650 [Candidatus Marsarchaeota G2 archaeon BE_D]|uniref:Uncharacterized protein n=1 Tax=Candidatus Marsarchaeota G2 archaeon BE_D TaxID=1978158 RepID=A0A2R6CCJ2_9ARCH|nr:MAG: hypothetical protein B9Q04_04650 [Candidatus Marsarchaeota G2 archaeon BE_D]
MEIYLNVTSSIQAANATQYVGEFITVPPNGQTSVLLHYETLGSPFNLTVFNVSNQSVEYAVIDESTQATVFGSQPVTITNLSIEPFTDNYTLTGLGPGIYELVITNNRASPSLRLPRIPRQPRIREPIPQL